MRYSLYVSYHADDKTGAFSWALSNYENIVDQGVFLVPKHSKDDVTRVSHIGLARALRKTSRKEGVIQLTIFLDEQIGATVGFELVGASEPAYPSLLTQTRRALKRFDSYKLASFSDENDLRPIETAVIDDAMDALEEASTLKGRWNLWKWQYTQPQRIIL